MSKGQNSLEKPNIYRYSCYRTYLRDYYAQMKESTPYFSYRYFSKQAGFRSPNYYKLVSEGKRNLSTDGIQKFIKALRLDTTEAKQFRLLVMMGQAGSSEERDFFTKQIFKSKDYQREQPLSEAHYNFLTRWYSFPLSELFERPDFVDDPKWIARQLTPEIQESEAKQALDDMLTLGLIEKNEDGRFVKKDQILTTGNEISHYAVKNYHKEMIRLGAESLDRFEGSDREVSSMTVGMSLSTYKKFKEMIQDFKKQLVREIGVESKVERVMQVNFQMFPLTTDCQEEVLYEQA